MHNTTESKQQAELDKLQEVLTNNDVDGVKQLLTDSNRRQILLSAAERNLRRISYYIIDLYRPQRWKVLAGDAKVLADERNKVPASEHVAYMQHQRAEFNMAAAMAAYGLLSYQVGEIRLQTPACKKISDDVIFHIVSFLAGGTYGTPDDSRAIRVVFTNRRDNNKLQRRNADAAFPDLAAEYPARAAVPVQDYQQEGYPPLFAAIFNKKYALVEQQFSLASLQQTVLGMNPLYFAAMFGSYVTVDIILQHLALQGVKREPILNQPRAGQSRATPLMIALWEQHPAVAYLLLEYMPDLCQQINSVNANGVSVLHMAAYRGRGYVDVIELLLRKLKDPQAAICQSGTKERTTALHIACSYGYENVVELFLSYLPKADAILEQVDKQGFTALAKACECGHIDVVEQLLRKGALVSQLCLEITAIAGRSGVMDTLLCHQLYQQDVIARVLFFSCKYGHVKITSSLVDYAMTYFAGDAARMVDIPGREGYSTLHIAAQGDSWKVIDQLLYCHPAIEQPIEGYALQEVGVAANALDLAVMCGRTAIVDHFVWKNLVDIKLLIRALSFGCRCGKLSMVLDLWEHLESKVQCEHEFVKILNDPVMEGYNLLHWAACGGDREIVDDLLRRGAIVDKIGGELQASALIVAAYNDKAEVVQLLLNKGAKPTCVRDNTGATALLAACKYGATDTVAVLFKYLRKKYPSQVVAALANSPNNFGHTPLFIAAQSGFVAVIKLLLKHYAAVNQLSGVAQLTPLTTAVQHNQQQAASLLLTDISQKLVAGYSFELCTRAMPANIRETIVKFYHDKTVLALPSAPTI